MVGIPLLEIKKFLGVLVSWFFGFKIVWFLGLKFQSFLVSSFKVSKAFDMLEDIDPMLPNFDFMLSGRS